MVFLLIIFIILLLFIKRIFDEIKLIVDNKGIIFEKGKVADYINAMRAEYKNRGINKDYQQVQTLITSTYNENINTDPFLKVEGNLLLYS